MAASEMAGVEMVDAQKGSVMSVQAPPPQAQHVLVQPALVVRQQQDQGCCQLKPNRRGNIETHDCGECDYSCYVTMIITFGVVGGSVENSGLRISSSRWRVGRCARRA
mmetsp:Transcript_30691/g.98909  ORF Transcript_30691/g.98909 Transcript_30691/m.98909 type:complete len:108 (+) Transcript_30691:118-441(+)